MNYLFSRINESHQVNFTAPALLILQNTPFSLSRQIRNECKGGK
jgi:hypothetical protein